MIFPEFENGYILERLRRRFDPQPSGVAPHVTLVFPFECDAPNGSLERHLWEAVRSRPPFTLSLRGIVGNPQGYLFLRVWKGGDEIHQLHERLCSGILAPHRLGMGGYLPHLTVARLDNGARVHSAVQELEDFDECFKTRVGTISVVTWDSDFTLRRDFEVRLGSSSPVDDWCGSSRTRVSLRSQH